VKTFLLMQAHFSHLPLPNSDYLTDTKSVLDQAIRVIQAMIDICAEQGWLATVLRIQQLLQCIVQARWLDDPVVLTLPNVEEQNLPCFKALKISFPMITLPGLKDQFSRNYESFAGPLRTDFEESQIETIFKVLCDMPTIHVEIKIRGQFKEQPEIERPVMQPLNRDQWLEVHLDQEYTINVTLTRLGKRNSSTIHCPKFPKGKDEGWFLTLGNQNDGELIALKRIGHKSSRSFHQLTFVTPKRTGRVIYTLYLLSDGYLGLDQQYNIQLDVVEPYNIPEELSS